MEPVGEVHFGDDVGERGVVLLLEPADDVAVAETVVEHLVDAKPEGVGEAGDFAVAGTVLPAHEGVAVPAMSGGFVLSRSTTTNSRFIHFFVWRPVVAQASNDGKSVKIGERRSLEYVEREEVGRI